MDLSLLKEVWHDRMIRPGRFESVIKRNFGDILRHLDRVADLPEQNNLADKMEIASKALCRIACGGQADELKDLALSALQNMQEVDEALPLYAGEEHA